LGAATDFGLWATATACRVRPESGSSSASVYEPWPNRPSRDHAPATITVSANWQSAARHDGTRGPPTGRHVRPPSVVVNSPEGKASLPSPPTYPFLSSKNRTRWSPGRTLRPTSSHFSPPSVVRSMTPTDPPPGWSSRPTAHPLYGLKKWTARSDARVPDFCRSQLAPPSIVCQITPSSP